MKGAVAEQNYWPGYLDALINVILNLLFLVALFAMGLVMLNFQMMAQQAQLSNLAAAGSSGPALAVQSQQIIEGMGLGAAEKARLTNRLATMDVQAMVDRRRQLDAQRQRVALQEGKAAAEGQALRPAETGQDKARREDTQRQLADLERQLKEASEKLQQAQSRPLPAPALRGATGSEPITEFRVAARVAQVPAAEALALLTRSLGRVQAVWEFAPAELSWAGHRPAPLGYEAADKSRTWRLVVFTETDNPRILRESFARAQAVRERLIQDGYGKEQIQVELKPAAAEGVSETAYRWVFMVRQ